MVPGGACSCGFRSSLGPRSARVHGVGEATVEHDESPLRLARLKRNGIIALPDQRGVLSAVEVSTLFLRARVPVGPRASRFVRLGVDLLP